MGFLTKVGNVLGRVVGHFRHDPGKLSIMGDANRTGYLPASKVVPLQALEPAPEMLKADGDPIKWVRHLQPPQRHRIEYADRHGEYSIREVAVARLGTYKGNEYLGVYEAGKFKSFRADHVLSSEPLDQHATIILKRHAFHGTQLPTWHAEGVVLKVPQTVGNRRWTVDLNAYTCTCPERRVRIASGRRPGTLGIVCLHMAGAILDSLPATHAWPPEIVEFLQDGERVSISSTL